jgi:CubicO group peptidase (beta-lactamase class C family)
MTKDRFLRIARALLALCLLLWVADVVAQPPAFDAALCDRIDAFIEGERQASGIPGIALAIVDEHGAVHVRGFGDDGHGAAIDGDTPFPIGSLTKSFTALLVRQAIDAGELDADAPVQRYLPWFRVADAEASTRITLRHLLNQTSGFSRADGIAPLLQGSTASIEELVRGLSTVPLNRPVGERFEYSNLNYVLLAAVLQAATRRPWGELMQARVMQPLAMTHSHVDHAAAQRDGLTALYQIVFGVPIERQTPWLPAFEPTGGLVASANDMARYLQMLLDGGQTPSGRVVSAAGVAQLLAPASPPAHSTLLSADFDFRYGEGWFVGPFGAATDARWHLGSLTTFAAWMVVLPETKQAVVVLINANSELPLNEVNAVMSRLPIGVVNLLRGQPVPQGPSLRSAYRPLDIAAALLVIVLTAAAYRAACARRAVWSVAMLLLAFALVGMLQFIGLGPAMLFLFAPDLALVLAAAGVLLCLPAALRGWRWSGERRRGTGVADMKPQT